MQEKAEVYQGYDYCDKMVLTNKYFYNDGFKRNTRVSLKENDNLSVLDFYSEQILYNYNSIPNFKEANQNLKNKIYPDNSLEPIIVAERFYDGFGCKYIDGLNEHIEKMKTYKSLKIITIFVFITSFVLLIADITIYLIIDKKDDFKYKIFRLIILILFGLLNVLVLISFFKAKNAYEYFLGYVECQNNFYLDSFANSNSVMEESFYYSYLSFYKIAVSLWLVSGLGFLSSVIYVVGIYINKFGVKISENENLSEKSNSLMTINA